MSSDLPAPDAKIWLRMPCGVEEHQTVVVSTTGGGLVVLPPRTLTGQCLPEDRPSEGQEIFVVWVHREQPMQVRTRFVTILDDPPEAWHLETTGMSEPTQRRKFVRTCVTMQVELLSDDGRDPVHGHLSNLSEGGARALVPSEWIRTPTQNFTMVLPEVEGGVTVRAYIRWLAMDEPGQCKVGLHFLDLPEQVADQIRSYVFARQLAERRRARGL